MMLEIAAQFSSSPPAEEVRSRSPSPLAERDVRECARWGERRSTTQPSRDVIVLGLDMDVDAERLRTLIAALADMVQARLAPPPQDVTVIRDRNTGASKGFGFAKFDTLEDAKRFVYVHAPFIHNAEQWLGPAPAGDRTRRKRIKVDFSNSERPQGGISYYEQHNAPNSKDQLKRARARRARGESGENADSSVDHVNENAGLRDASAVASDMLLLTGLPDDASAEGLGNALLDMSVCAPVAKALERLERVALVRERSTRASTRRAFVFFSGVDAARAMLQALRSKALLPHGFLGAPGVPGARTSYGDAVVLDEADPYDPTCAAWTLDDAQGRTWRYEDEALGFDVWEAAPAREQRARTASLSLTPVEAPLPAPAPVVSRGTTFYVHDVDALSAVSTTATPAAAASAPTFSTTHAALRLLNYADVPRRICLLCQRQFKTPELLARHGVESTLHYANLDDEAACRAGAARVLAHIPMEKENTTAAAPSGLAKCVPSMDKSTPELARRPALQPVGWNDAPAHMFMHPVHNVLRTVL